MNEDNSESIYHILGMNDPSDITDHTFPEVESEWNSADIPEEELKKAGKIIGITTAVTVGLAGAIALIKKIRK